MKLKSMILGLIFSISPVEVFAAASWTEDLRDIQIYTDSGKLYLKASNMPANCSNSRAQIDLDGGGIYEQSLFSQILAFYMEQKTIKIVVNVPSTAGNCTILGVRDW